MTDRKSAAPGRKPSARSRAAHKSGEMKKAVPAAKKTAASPQLNKTERQTTKKALPTKKAVSAPAAPLLARAPKKVGKVMTAKAAEAPKTDAPYQPKTEAPPPAPRLAEKAAPRPLPLPRAINPLAIAMPWMRLGFQVALAGIAMQTRMARAALDAPRLFLPRTPKSDS